MRLPSLFAVLLLCCAGLARPGQAETPVELGRRWAGYAQALAAKERHSEAGPAFDRALLLAPADPAILRARGQWRWTQGQREAALQDLRASLAADPSQAALKAWLAKLDAAAPVAAAPAAGPADDEALAEAQAQLELRDFNAVLAAEAAQTARPEPVAWLRLRSEALYGLGRFDEAKQALDAARAQAPEEPGLERLDERYYHSGLAPDSGGGPILPPLLRSAVLPGWGQAYNGQRRKAWITGALTLGLLAATAYTYVATDQALADYHALGASASAADFDAAFGRADGLAVINQACGIAFYTAYAYNLFDAAAGARPAAPAPRAQGARVTVLALRF